MQSSTAYKKSEDRISDIYIFLYIICIGTVVFVLILL